MDPWLNSLTGVLIPIVAALRQVPALKVRTWLLPFLSAALGLLGAYAVNGFPATPGLILPGLTVGLAACGLYDAGRGVLAASEKRGT